MSRHKSLFRDIIPRLPSAFNYILIGNDSIIDPNIYFVRRCTIILVMVSYALCRAMVIEKLYFKTKNNHF